MEQPSEPASVLRHVLTQVPALDDSARRLLVDIDTKLPEELRYFLIRRDGAAILCESLPTGVIPGQIEDEKVQEIWHLCGLYYFSQGRFHEALAVFVAFYDQMLKYQEDSQKRIHKGTPLVRISECHQRLGHTALSKRYLMLTACEDAIQHQGRIDAETTGVYFRMIWAGGMGHWAFQRYAMLMWETFQEHSREAFFPEWVLQELDHDWMTEYPSSQEAAVYMVTLPYVRWLLTQLGSGAGQNLERLAHYLLSCMPGCRAHKRKPAVSTDYDVVCTVEGVGLDFRSELGRYFICECKDWERKADFTVLAKFCRVLDSAKCSFGILFSKEGITGQNRASGAEREQIKVFQQRGMVVIVIAESDLKNVAAGANFLTMLRSKYEQVRLDLRA